MFYPVFIRSEMVSIKKYNAMPKSNILKVKFIAPCLGSKSLGRFLVEYKKPVLSVNRSGY